MRYECPKYPKTLENDQNAQKNDNNHKKLKKDKNNVKSQK